MYHPVARLDGDERGGDRFLERGAQACARERVGLDEDDGRPRHYGPAATVAGARDSAMVKMLPPDSRGR